MATPNSPKDNARLNAAKRKIFFSHLSQTANVSASARLAELNSGAIYSERLRSREFRAKWSEALAEGYARLEADLLAEALQAANGKTSDGTIKARAQKHRLAIALLGIHRASVKGGTPSNAYVEKTDLRTIKAKLILELTQMRGRAGIPLDGVGDSDPTQHASKAA
jgi:hypothetical protein